MSIWQYSLLLNDLGFLKTWTLCHSLDAICRPQRLIYAHSFPTVMQISGFVSFKVVVQFDFSQLMFNLFVFSWCTDQISKTMRFSEMLSQKKEKIWSILNYWICIDNHRNHISITNCCKLRVYTVYLYILSVAERSRDYGRGNVFPVCLVTHFAQEWELRRLCVCIL